MIVKYRVTLANGFKEFTEELDAQLCAAQNNTNYSLVEEVEPPFDYSQIPNVTPRQFRQALVIHGVSMASVESAINSLPEPNKSLAMIEWEYSTAFIRSNPLIDSIGALVGKTPTEINEIWETAQGL